METSLIQKKNLKAIQIQICWVSRMRHKPVTEQKPVDTLNKVHLNAYDFKETSLKDTHTPTLT